MSEVFYRGKSPCGYDLPMYHVCNSCRTLIAGVLAIIITPDAVFHEHGDYVSASSYDFVQGKGYSIDHSSLALNPTGCTHKYYTM